MTSEQLEMLRERFGMKAERDVANADISSTESCQSLGQGDECPRVPLSGPRTNMRRPDFEEMKSEWTGYWELIDPFTRLALIHLCVVYDESLSQVLKRALYLAVSENCVLRSHRRQLNLEDADIEQSISGLAQLEELEGRDWAWNNICGR